MEELDKILFILIGKGISELGTEQWASHTNFSDAVVCG